MSVVRGIEEHEFLLLMLMLKAVIYEGLPSMKMEIYGMFKIVCLYFPLVE